MASISGILRRIGQVANNVESPMGPRTYGNNKVLMGKYILVGVLVRSL